MPYRSVQSAYTRTSKYFPLHTKQSLALEAQRPDVRSLFHSPFTSVAWVWTDRCSGIPIRLAQTPQPFVGRSDVKNTWRRHEPADTRQAWWPPVSCSAKITQLFFAPAHNLQLRNATSSKIYKNIMLHWPSWIV